MSDLTSYGSFTAWNGPVADADQSGVQALITACSEWVRSYTGRDFTIASYSRSFDGRNNVRMVLPQTPIVAVTSVTVSGIAIPARQGWGQAGYYFDEDSVCLSGHCFERGTSNVIIAWQAGYASVPAEIEQAVNELVGLRYALRDKQGWSAKSLAGETVTLMVRDMPESVRTILDSARRVA